MAKASSVADLLSPSFILKRVASSAFDNPGQAVTLPLFSVTSAETVGRRAIKNRLISNRYVYTFRDCWYRLSAFTY